jgi:Cu-processing system permease protein
VAYELLIEAFHRRWVLALGAGVTLVLLVVASALRLEVVDGALAATRLFGDRVDADIRAVDVALRPVFQGAAWVVYYGGLGFGVVACADFAPTLLRPGRIEHLIAQPLHRWHLVVGTYLGVFLLSLAGALYGAGGFAVILGIKTGVWTTGPLVAALLASIAFASVYGVMLAAATFARSAALSAVVGGGVLVAGIVASYRPTIAEAFDPGFARTLFALFTMPLPRVASLGVYAGELAASAPVDAAALARVLAGVVLVGLSGLAVAAWHFERKDF